MIKTDVEIFCKVVEGRVACNHTSRYYIEVCPRYTDARSIAVCAVLSCISCVFLALTVCARKYALKIYMKGRTPKLNITNSSNEACLTVFGIRRAALISTIISQVILTVACVLLISFVTDPIPTVFISIPGIILFAEIVPLLCRCCRYSCLPKLFLGLLTVVLGPISLPVSKLLDCFHNRSQSLSLNGSHYAPHKRGETYMPIQNHVTMHRHVNSTRTDEVLPVPTALTQEKCIKDCYTPISELTILDLSLQSTTPMQLFPHKVGPEIGKESEKPILIRRIDAASEERNLQLLDIYSLLKELSKGGSFPTPVSNLLHENADRYCLYLPMVSEDAQVRDVARLLLRGPTTVALVSSHREVPHSHRDSSIAHTLDRVGVLVQIPTTSDDIDIPDGHAPLEIRLKMGANTIGRQPTRCTGCIPSKTVSKLHAIIELDCNNNDQEEKQPLAADPAENRATIVDCGSVNGTFLNEQRLEPDEKHELNENSFIAFGSSRFQFKWATSLSICSRMTKSQIRIEEEILGVVTQKNLLSLLLDDEKCEDIFENGPISITI